MVGDACVYNSKSTGDIQTKPECEPYKNSYSEHPFILPDAAAVYAKAAYLLQTKVLIHTLIILRPLMSTSKSSKHHTGILINKKSSFLE